MVSTAIGMSIDRAVQLLRAGEIIGMPTETVYGLAGNGLAPTVVAKIYAAKNRPSFDPMILHAYSKEAILSFVKDIPDPLLPLVEKFMPGPLTILLEKKDIVPDVLTAGLPKVAVRIPSHKLARELLKHLDFPLAAPSANPFGYISPTTALHVKDQLEGIIPYILDGGSCEKGLESTIIEYEDNKIVVLRKGSVSIEDIESVVGKVDVRSHSSSNPKAPGMIKSHYAPRIATTLNSIHHTRKSYKLNRIGYLGWNKMSVQLDKNNQRVLSFAGDLNEAARNLFRYLRELDALDLDIIILKKVPNLGLGRAINDKLNRAAAKD